MFANYFKVVCRNLVNQKSFSLINIFGLALGIAVCVLILLYIKTESSFDKFNEHANRIYRIERQSINSNGEVRSQTNTLAPSFKIFLEEYFPEFENMTRIFNPHTKVTIGSTGFNTKRLFFAEDDIFEIYTLQMIAGEPGTALKEPFSVVLSESVAQKYFGIDDPMGQRLEIFGKSFTVRGIIKDMPLYSHVHFELLASYKSLRGYGGSYNIKEDYFLGKDNFSDNVTYIYAKIAEGVDVNKLASKMPDFLDSQLPPIVTNDGRTVSRSERTGIGFRNLLDIHIRDDGEIDIEPTIYSGYITLFTVIAIFILVIACINYINLSTARGIKRAREVGLRKVVGSTRSSLIVQFLLESLFLSFIAVVIATLLVFFILPYFESFTGLTIEYNLLPDSLVTLIVIGVFVLAGLGAGIFPAFYLSAFRPINILRGDITRGAKGAVLRKSLVVFQFTVSAALIMSVIVIYNQMEFMRNADLGFNKENVVMIPIDNNIRKKWDDFKQKLLSSSNITSVTASKRAPSGFLSDAPGFTIELNGEILRSPFNMPHNRVWHDFFKTYEMEIIAGRDLSEEFPTDDSLAYVLNETACRNLGIENPNDVIGASFRAAGYKEGKVIGVVKDFNYETLRNDIKPIVTYIAGWVNTIGVRIAPGNYQSGLKHIEETFAKYSPGTSFEFSFLDDRFNALYKNESTMMELFIYFSSLAIIIACLGLFGLAEFTAERKTKEVGIRKVMGASVKSISILLSKQFTKWVIIANVISFPIINYLMNQWLANFAYRTEIGISVFIIALALSLLIALLTIGYKTIKAATLNPADSLRYE